MRGWQHRGGTLPGSVSPRTRASCARPALGQTHPGSSPPAPPKAARVAPGPEPPRAGPARSGSPGHPWAAPGASLGRAPGRHGSLTLAALPRAHPRDAPANCHTRYGSLRTAYLARGDWGMRPRPLDPRCERKAKRHLLFSHIIGGTAAPPSSPACPLLHTPLAAQQGKAGGASPSWAAAAYRSTTQTSRDRPYLRATYIRCRPLE